MEQNRPTRLFKGPLFLPSRSRTARQFSDVPVARGNIDEQDYAESMLSRAYLRRVKEAKESKDER
jgi:hypothetical protein